MKYITKELVQVNKTVVSHPKIKYSWDYGYLSMSPSGECGYGIAMIVDNEKEERKDFIGKTFEEAANKAEEFLETLT